MVEVSIICLIYKSSELAEALYDSLRRHTPMLTTGRVEFFFIANDPTSEVVELLKSKKIPHYININNKLSDKDLYSLGFGSPEYIRRVYQGYNFGIMKAKGQKVVLINSDNFFSADWLENLLKYSDYNKVVSSTLVEPGHARYGVFPSAIEMDFGRNLDDFSEVDFLSYSEKIKKTGISSGGAYMPCLLYKDIAVMAGLYPEGNLAGSSFNEIVRYGDEFFYDKLKSFGVEHITSKDSIVYHLKEGEKNDDNKQTNYHKANKTRHIPINTNLKVKPKKLIQYFAPEEGHQEIITKLLNKFSALILNPRDIIATEKYLENIKNLHNKNIEVVIVSRNKRIIKSFSKKVDMAIYAPTSEDVYLKTSWFVNHMYGEHLIILGDDIEYTSDLLSGVDSTDYNYYFGPNLASDGMVTDKTSNFIFSKKHITQNLLKMLNNILNERSSIGADITRIISRLDLEDQGRLKNTYSLTKKAKNILVDSGPKELIHVVYRKAFRK